MTDEEVDTTSEDHDTSQDDITSDQNEDVEVVPPIQYTPIFTWPVRGLFVVETSYADFEDLGASEGGTVALGKVLTTSSDAGIKLFTGLVILFRADAGERWRYGGHWYRFLPDVDSVIATITDSDHDPRISDIQAIQQARSASRILYPTPEAPRPERDYTDWP